MAIIERINTFPNGAQANQPGGTNWFDRYGGFSPDNTKVIFHAAPNFASDHWNVIIKDRITGGLSAVDTLANGQAAIASTTGAGSWSVDGTKIVFFSDARNIPDSATGTFANTNQTDSIPDWWHIYVKTLSTGLFQRVTPDNANGSSDIPYFSADGTKVVYSSAASNIVAGDTNQKWDVFVRDLATNTTTRISIADNEAQSAHHAFEPAVVGYNPALFGSSWGTFHPTNSNLVMFMSSGNNLVAGDTNAAPFAPGIGEWGFDVFIRDLAAGTTTRVSLSDDDQQLLGSSGPGFWSPDGNKVLFNNPTGAGIYGQQVLIRDLAPGTTTLVSTTAAGVKVNGEAAAWSNDGRSVTFSSGNPMQIYVKDVSGARVLANPDGIANNGDEYFYYPGELTLVSVSEGGTPGNVFSQGSLFNTTDTRVMFRSEATNLLPNGADSNGISDVYVRLIPGTAQVTGVTSNTADGTYGIGAVIDVRVTFSAPVTVTGGTPTITLETGVTDVVVNLTGGSGTNTLSGSFTVVAGHNSSDLDYLHFLSLRENGSSIVDANGRPVDLEMSVPGAVGSLGNAKNIVIETSPPVLEAVTSTTANGFYKAGEAINITLQFSEAVTLVGNLNVTLDTGDVVTFSNQSGTSLSATYTPQSGDNTADLTNTAIALAGGATLRDAASNNADLTMATNLGANKDIAIDTTVPTITSVTSTTANGTYGIGANINITVNFSEMVTLTGGSLQVTLDTGDVITFTQPIVNVSTVSATYVVSAGDNTLDLDTTSIAIVGGSSPVLQDRARNAIVNFTPGTDLAVNKDIVILTTPPDPPVITGVTEDRGIDGDEITSDANLFIDGTSGANATIQVTRVGVGVIGTTQADGDGNWSFDYTATTLADGPHQFTAIVDAGLDSDPSNTLTVTIDTQIAVSQPDLVAASDSGVSDTDDITNDATPTFTGTTDIGNAVVIVDGADTLGTATVDGAGNWTFTPSAPLADGGYEIAALATDLAGNETTSGALAVTIDTAVNISAPDLLPGSDNGPFNDDDITNITTPTIQVTGDDGDVVELREGMSVLGTATISGGVATFNPSLSHGTRTLTAHGTDAAGNTVDTDALVLTIDTIAPAISTPDLHPDSDSGSSQTDNFTNDQSPTFTGTAEAGAKVELRDTFNQVVGSTFADGDGNWSITATFVDEEFQRFSARATDLAGNVATSGFLGIFVDFETRQPTLDLTDASDSGVLNDDDLTNADPLVFAGTTEVNIPATLPGVGSSPRNMSVTLYDVTGGGETALGTFPLVANTNSWTISVDGLAEGTYDLVARANEALFGNSADSPVLTVTVDRTVVASAPDLAAASDSGRSDTDDVTNDTTPELTGTGEDGAIVTLMEGAAVLGTTTITGGTWSITTGTLSDGDHDVFARVVDRAGNMRDTDALTVTIDTVDPPVSVPDMTAATDLGASSVDNHTADPTPDFAGTSETDAIVELIVDGTPSGVTTLAAPGGAWTLTAPALSEGIHQISARATDVAGNVSDPSGALQVSIDLTPPETLIDGGPPPESNDNTPTFDFFSPDPEATFQASIDGGPFQPVGDPHTFPPIPDGDHVLRARAVDRAGNVDPTPAEWRWFHDATPPLPPVITRFADDSAPVGDRVTTDRTLEIFGTAEPNSQLRLMEAGLGLVGTVMVDGAGNWRIGPTGMLDEGVYTFTATASDRVGNLSDPSLPFVVIVDEPGNPTPLPDLLVGNDQANQIQGLGGNDTIFGFGGNDTVRGNDGNDSLLGGSGRDKLEGENGDDALLGEADNDSLYGGNGRDRADGGAGSDRIEAGAGNDELLGGDGADTMFGGTGADTLTGGAGADRLSGDAEGDLLLLGDDGARDSVAGTVAHLSGDTIDGFVGGAPTHAGADVLLIQGLSLANARKLDGDLLVGGVLSLAEVGGGEITFDDLLNPGTMRVDTALGASGEVLIYIV